MKITSSQVQTLFAPHVAAGTRPLGKWGGADIATIKTLQGPLPKSVQRAVQSLNAMPIEAGEASETSKPAIRDHADVWNVDDFKKSIEGYLRLQEMGMDMGIPSTMEENLARFEKAKAYFAGERQFAEENGFTRMVNAQSRAVYDKVKAGNVPSASFASQADAKEFALGVLQDINMHLRTINSLGEGDAELGGAYKGLDEADLANPAGQWMNATQQDRLEGSRIDLFVKTEYLKKTFNIDGPIVEKVDGKLQLRAFDIERKGEAIVNSAGGGTVMAYREDGTLALDRRV